MKCQDSVAFHLDLHCQSMHLGVTRLVYKGRLSSAHQQKSRCENLEKVVKNSDYRCKKVGIIELFQSKN